MNPDTSPAPDFGSRSAWIALSLLFALCATHPHQLGSITHLPNITVALMFLGGVYLRRALWWLLLFLCTVFIDNLSIRHAGVSSHCITPAYLFMLPAYAVPWHFGKLFARKHASLSLHHPASLCLHALVSSSISFFLSNDSFYFLSGYFTPNLGEYLQRFTLYYPEYAATPCIAILLYAGAADLAGRLTQTRRNAIATRKAH